MRLLLAVAGCLCVCTMATARPYGIDDMLRLEGYGQVVVAPDGRRVLVERRSRYDGATRYTYGYQVRRLVSRVMATDMETGARLVPAFPQEARAGYWIGGFAPTGARFTVFRLKDDRLRLGVADLDRRAVRWLEGAPDLPIAAPAPVWLDTNRILYMRFVGDQLPLVLDHAGVVQKVLPQRWRDAANGDTPSADVATTRGFRAFGPREERELVEVDLAAGRYRVIARGPLLDYLVSPARDRVAVVTRGDRVQPDPKTLIAADYQAERHGLKVIDIWTGRTEASCASCDLSPRPLEFSREGDLVVRARRDGEPWAQARVLIIDRAGGRLSSAGGGATTTATWVDTSLLLAGKDARWSCVRCSVALQNATTALPVGASLVANDGSVAWFGDQTGLWRLDASGRITLALSGALDLAGLAYLDPASIGTRALSAPVSPVVRRRGAKVDELIFGAAAPQLRKLAVPGSADILAASQTSGAAIGVVTDERGVGLLKLFRPKAAAKAIDAISRHLSDVDLPSATPIKRRGVDGAWLTDWLFVPPTSGRHPLIVIPYQGAVWGGTMPNQARPGYFGSATNVMLLVANGYAVLLPSLPAGPKGFPQSTLVAEVDKALDAAVATALVDPARIALFGHSYGGVNALYLAAHSSRFSAVIAASGSSDLAASYGELPPAERISMGGAVPLGEATAWFETGQGQLEAAPWDAPQRYLEASPFFRADRITAPVLLMAADLDYVPMEQAERLFVSLDRLGRDVTLVRYFGEGHVIQSPANIRLHWRTILSFLRRTMTR